MAARSAGGSSTTAAAAVKDIPAGAAAGAVDTTGAVAKADGGTTSATTRVASRSLAGAVVLAAGAVPAAGAGVVLANGEPTPGTAVLGCLRPIPIPAVVRDGVLESVPAVCGALVLSGVAAVLAGAVEEVEVCSVPDAVGAADADVGEPVGELPRGPPAATASTGAPRRVPLTGVTEGAAPVGADGAGDDVRARPELLATIWPGALSGR